VLAAAFEAIAGQPIAADYSPYCSTNSTTGVCDKTRDTGVWVSDGVPATPIKNAAQIPGLSMSFPDYCSR
jgi:hypothetical protein